MRPRILEVAVACLSVTAACLMTRSIVRSHAAEEPPTRVEQDNILRSAQKPKAPITDNTSRSHSTAAQLNNSMHARRDHAWSIVQQAWEPVQVSGSKIPAWMTWYEAEDIAQLYKELRSRQTVPTTPSDLASNLVDVVLKERRFKDLQSSLVSERLGKVLRQFTFPVIHSLSPNRKPGTGVIYYNTAYVRHLLQNAEKISRCDLSAFPKLRFPGSSQSGGLIDIDRLPLDLLPTDPNNRWALCMNHEMPPEAIMIKANWTAVVGYDDAGNAYVNEHVIDTSARMAANLSSLPAGRWIEVPWDDESKRRGGIKAAGLRVMDEKGKEWELRGMHIVKKNLRTWMWTTLFEAGGKWNWGADKPDALAQEWSSLAYYGMCTVSDFKEGDPTPWSAYDGKGEYQQSLADVLRAVAKVMEGAQWCSNPYIETNMAFGNCVGCHQGSTETVLPTTVFQAVTPVQESLDRLIPETLLKTTQIQLPLNTSDFSFSFATNRSAFQEIMRKPKP